MNEFALNEIEGEYIICEPCMVTGFDWQMLTDSTGNTEYIFVNGKLSNVHSILKREITSNNKFVLYGNFVDEREFYNEGKFKVFQAYDWDILAPVNRGTGIPKMFSPVYGLNIWDFY